jgi:HAD superfamily hydrolase (TIGR01509 family)
VLFPQNKDIKAVIFDMDGLLINSEPYWKMAEKKVFGQYGLDLSDELLRQVMGFRLSEVVKHWYTHKPWPNADFKATEEAILNDVTERILAHAEAMPGVYEVLEKCRLAGYKMAIASSSAMRLIEAVVNKLNIRNYFDVMWSAEFELYGKPHPGIFLSTANKLQTAPENCLVFEDAINGVLAAKAAKMYCIAVPEEATYHDLRFAIADKKIKSLIQLTVSST